MLVVIALAACSGDAGAHRWRDARITAPDGWVVHEEAATHFALTDAPLGTGEAPGPGVVGAFFTYEPTTTPDDWRELASDQGWTILEDEAIEVGGVPATRLVIDQPDQQVPTREMVVVIPPKGIVVLFQPTPTVDQSDGVERFQRWRPTFDAILSDLRFGAPVRDEALVPGRASGSVAAFRGRWDGGLGSTRARGVRPAAPARPRPVHVPALPR